ncbi:hypothetical protein [Bartonella grahamii]|uniref:DNA-binding protein n=1 Tax=Bartonella grahamii TaxID=33045 RepID=A0A336NN41_BARGR|nr:hypothetical protein [Bartonella grahamii]SSZ39898.1 Uncharacterised protein [Bartonella grahamii]SSZ40329.1 Uncharacterised protein [Bartonella grahamii]
MVNDFYVKSLIESWGSIRQFAKEIGCSYEAARKMRDRNSISPKYWNIIIQLSKAKGLSWVTLDWFLHNYGSKSHRVVRPMIKRRKDTLHLVEKISTANASQTVISSHIAAPTDNNEHQQQHSHS